MLAEHSQEKAVGYLFSQIDRVADWGDILQIAVLDLIRKVRQGGIHRGGWGLGMEAGQALGLPEGGERWAADSRCGCTRSPGRARAQRHRLLPRASARAPAAMRAPPQVCRTNPEQKGKYIKIILALLQSRSTAVMYECAVTLVSLSSAPTAVRAAANCFCQLLVSHSDNNVKLIVLDRLQARRLSQGWLGGRPVGWALAAA